jgi:hypothetical protein
MRNLKNRVQRIEGLVNEEEGLTADDAELVLSVLPKEYADAVLRRILEIGDENRAAGKYDHVMQRSGKTKERSGLHGKTLELILNDLPPECAAALRAKLGIKGKYFNKELTK